jgi:hypothetical protein
MAVFEGASFGWDAANVELLEDGERSWARENRPEGRANEVRRDLVGYREIGRMSGADVGTLAILND